MTAGEQHRCALCGASWVGAHVCSAPELAGLAALREKAGMWDRHVAAVVTLTADELAALRGRIAALEAVAAADLALIAELDAWLNDASSLRHDATRALHAAEARFHEARAAAGLP